MRLDGTEVWSCGGGTQSGAIAVLIGSGKLPKPDLCFMTNTGREKSGTWPFVEAFICPHLAKVGMELQIIQAADFGGGQPALHANPGAHAAHSGSAIRRGGADTALRTPAE